MEANREAAGPAMAGEVTRMVERARRRMRAATTLVGACHWVVTALGLWLAFFLADNVLALPAGLRLPLALAGGALLLWVLALRVLVPGFRRLRPEQVALFLEERYGIRENLLINAYQFEGRQFGEAEAEFAGSTISRCEAALEKLDLGQLWEMRRAWPWLAGALGVLLAWLVYAWLLPGFLVNAGQRFAMPLAEIPPPGAPVIRVTPSGEVAIAEGDSVEVKAEIIDRRPISVGQEAPPMIVWIENAETVPTVRGDGEEAAMASVAGGGGGWSHTFAGVRRSFAFRVFGAGTHSAPVSVRVHPLPKITASLFRVTPPEYTGMEATVSAGPPGTMSALIGSRVEIELAVGPRPGAVRWRDPSGVADMAFENGKWRATRVVAGAAPYEIEARVAGLGRDVVIARSQMQVAPDAPPEVEFGSADRNRFAFPGTTVALRVNARDDFGLRRVWITARPAEDDASARASVKSWSFLGPPGRKGEVQERAGLAIDPARFRVGESYLVEAWAADFNPKGKPVSSRPILIRIRSPMDSDLERGDPLVRPFERLRQAVAAQERAMGLAGNLRGHLEEAVAKQDLHEHRRAIGEAQGTGSQAAGEALEGFRSSEGGKAHAEELAPLVEGEMPWLVRDIERLNLTEPEPAARVVEAILARQTHVRDQMLALLGKIIDERKGKSAEAKAGERSEPTAEEVAKDIKAEVDSFLREQSRLVKKSKALAAKAGEGQRAEDGEAISDLARKEAQWAQRMRKRAEEAGARAKEIPMGEGAREALERVAAAARTASEALYNREVEKAVPPAEEALEEAEKLAAALGGQLGKAEEAAKGTPSAEAPAEAENAVRGLLDEQSALGDELDDVAGETIETGGRAGEGKAGRSSGSLIGGLGPEGLPGAASAGHSPAPMEKGELKAEGRGTSGGATGGGKAAGFAEVGLRGSTPLPAEPDGDAPRLTERQAAIRQKAEALALRLRKQGVATGDLENSVEAMREVEAALKIGDGFAVQTAHSSAVDSLVESRAAIRATAGVSREQTRLSERVRDGITAGTRDAIPKGYDEMTSAYFRAMAEGKAGLEGAPAPRADPAAPPPRR